MSDVRIYENPGNKAARLERENAQLRAENRRLREALGEGHAMVPQMQSSAPVIDQGASTFTHGACAVTIGRKPGAGRPGIPSLQQAPQEAGATTVAIYNASAAEADVAAQVAQALGAQPATTRPTVAAAGAAPRRMVNGQPAIGPSGGGGGMAEFNLGAMRPTPIGAPQPTPPRPATPPATPAEALDEARQRFSLLELDGEVQQTGTGK